MAGKKKGSKRGKAHRTDYTCAKKKTTCKKSTMIRVAAKRGDVWLNKHAHYTKAEMERKPLSQRTKMSKARRIGARLSRKGLGRLLGLFSASGK